MATKPIDYMVAYYGEIAWKDIVVRWNGTGKQWRLFLVGQADPLYVGDQQQYIFTGEPSNRYEFRVETTVDGTLYDFSVLTFTTSLPAPINLRASEISDTAAVLTWAKSDGVDKYEIADVTNSYTVIDTTTSPSYTLTRLKPYTRQSYAARSVYKDDRSKWSTPITFFTQQSDNIEPGTYEFTPAATYTWRAGRPGSTNPSWAPAQSNWYHGDGFVWGDNNGVQTTYFFFGANNPFHRLYGAVVTKCEVFLSRYTTGGEPGPVLSKLGLHAHKEKPDGEPTPGPASIDAGELNRGDGVWIEVPTEWAKQLIIGAYATGWYWGNCFERFQMAQNVDNSVNPRIGMVRITVG